MSSSANQLFQQAGQNLHAAIVALANASQASSAQLTELVYSNPGDATATRVLGTFTAAVQLGKELSALEERLLSIYEQSAGGLPAPAAIPLLTTDAKANATDVVAKVAPVRTAKAKPAAKPTAKPAVKVSSKAAKTEAKAPVKAPAAAKPAPAPKAAVVAKAVTKKASKPSTDAPKALSGNSEKVFKFLKTVLNTETYVKVVQAAIAKGAGLPNGSVAASLSALKTVGAIKEGNTGEFKLAA